MSTIHVCDRYTKRIKTGYYTANYQINISNEDKDIIYKWDLCEKCKELFEDYLADFIDYCHSDKEVKEWCNG